MLIRTLPTTLLQIFSKIILIVKVSVQSILHPDNNFQEERVSIKGRAALTTHKLEWLEPWGKLAELELKCSNRELVYIYIYIENANVTQSTQHKLLTYVHNCLSLSCLFNNLQCIYIQAVSSVILTFVPRQHVLKLNKYGIVNKSPPINIHFLIAGLKNKYFFRNNWNFRELMSSRVKQVMSSWVDLPPWVSN